MSLYQLYSSCSFNYCQLDTTDRCNASSVHLLAVLFLTTVTCKQLKGVANLQYVNVVVSTTMSCKVCYRKLYILGFSFTIITNISCNFKLHKIMKKRMKKLISPSHFPWNIFKLLPCSSHIITIFGKLFFPCRVSNYRPLDCQSRVLPLSHYIFLLKSDLEVKSSQTSCAKDTFVTVFWIFHGNMNYIPITVVATTISCTVIVVW